MNPHSFAERFQDHTVKILPSGPEIGSYFIFRTGTTTDAVNLVTQMGRLYMSSHTIGTFVLEPFAPDPMIWLRRNINDPRAIFDAIPPNLKPAFTCVRPPEIDQFANLLEGAVSAADENDEAEYRDLLDWLYAYRDDLKPIPAIALADRLEHSRFFEDGMVTLSDLHGLITYNDTAFTYLALLERFVDVAEQRFQDEDIPWHGWRNREGPLVDELEALMEAA